MQRKFRGITLKKDADGLRIVDIEPIDPTEDITRTGRAILWIIGVLIWLVGKVRGKEVREEMAATLLRDYYTDTARG